MIVWGDVHAHSGLSDDATGDVREFFRIARDVVHLDFVVLSDHDIYLTPEEWQAAKDAAAEFDEPGRFAALAGVEWSHAWHMNYYFRGDGGEICGGGGGPPCPSGADARAFYAPRVLDGAGASHVNHPSPLSRVHWEQVWDDLATNVEMFNTLWSFNVGPDAPELWFGGPLWALQVGFRFGFVGVSDDHFIGVPGFYLLGTGLTACDVDGLSRGAIIDALRNRRCYASNGHRTLLDFDVDGTAMGGELSAPMGSTVTASVSVRAPSTPTLIELIANGGVVARKTDCTDGSCSFSVPIRVAEEYNFVYAKVFEGDVYRTWSSPVWVRGACATPRDCPRERVLPPSGDPSASCLATWRALPAADRDSAGHSYRRVTCTAGDPACDFDFDPAGCTFRVGLCFGVEQGRDRSCRIAPIERYDLSTLAPRGERDTITERRNRSTLGAAAQALRSAREPGRCSPYLRVHVPLRRLSGGALARSARSFVLRTGAGERTDVDRLTLVCEPPAANAVSP